MYALITDEFEPHLLFLHPLIMYLYCVSILLLIITCKEASESGPHSTRDQCDSDTCPDPQRGRKVEKEGGQGLQDREETTL